MRKHSSRGVSTTVYTVLPSRPQLSRSNQSLRNLNSTIKKLIIDQHLTQVGKVPMIEQIPP